MMEGGLKWGGISMEEGQVNFILYEVLRQWNAAGLFEKHLRGIKE